MSSYLPPFTISSQSIKLISNISMELERYKIRMEETDSLRLRKINRIKTIRGSLAIEGNTLSEDLITAILEGKHVIAPLKEIQEVRNAIEAYNAFKDINPYDEKDFLKIHGILMKGLIDEVGSYRSGGVGVIAGKEIIHLAPPAKRVPELMSDLFSWVKKSEDHPLIKSSVFHYEFEFIHPFADGNGRMGRLWQTRLLSEWNESLAYLPIENMIYEHQEAYYKAINLSTEKADSGIFIEFMLEMIFSALRQHRKVEEASKESTPQVAPQVTPQVKSLLAAYKKDSVLSRKELQARLGLKDAKNFREKYVLPAIQCGVIEMTIPEKPNSRMQKYKRVKKGI